MRRVGSFCEREIIGEEEGDALEENEVNIKDEDANALR